MRCAVNIICPRQKSGLCAAPWKWKRNETNRYRVPMISSTFLWRDNFIFYFSCFFDSISVELIETIEKRIVEFVVVVCYLISQHSVSHLKCFHLKMWCSTIFFSLICGMGIGKVSMEMEAQPWISASSFVKKFPLYGIRTHKVVNWNQTENSFDFFWKKFILKFPHNMQLFRKEFFSVVWRIRYRHRNSRKLLYWLALIFFFKNTFLNDKVVVSMQNKVLRLLLLPSAE